jgi:hypothetical protein
MLNAIDGTEDHFVKVQALQKKVATICLMNQVKVKMK